MDTEIKNAVSAADQDAQYDDRAKRLLGNKIILAHIPGNFLSSFSGDVTRQVPMMTERGYYHICPVLLQQTLLIKRRELISDIAAWCCRTGNHL